ncbi:MAG TPA: stalk domain-containing protein [Caldisericia bacterium]|nr:stalk domain-containing protein [Caldisericia bacterium]
MKLILSFCLSIALMMQALPLGFAQTVPDPPGDLMISAMYDQINLTWKDYSDNEKGFSLERKTGREEYQEIAVISPDSEYYLDLQLNYPATFFYRICAFNDTGKSRYSNEVFARTEAPPPQEAYDAPLPPQDLNARVISEKEVELTWKDQSSNEDGFKLERRTPSSDYEEIIQLPANTNSYLDQSVEAKQFYYYRIRSYNLIGESSYSNEVVVETRIIEKDLPPVEAPPKAPTNLNGALEGSVIMLRWTDESNDETGFRIYYAMNDIDNVSLYQQLPKDTIEYGITDLYLPGNTFFFYVTAYNTFGESTPTDTVMVRIRAEEEKSVPKAPENLVASEIYERDIVLNWVDKSDNEEGFKIERRKVDEVSFKVIITLPKDTQSFRDPGLESGSTYFYRIFAFNNSGNSWPSNTIEAKTKGLSGGYVPPEAKIVIILQIGSNRISINGKISEMDARPSIYEGRTLLPIRPVVEALGGTIEFEPHSKTITIKLKTITIIMQLNNPQATVNGKQVSIDSQNPKVVPMVVPPGRTLVPLRFVAENLGCKVEWEANEKKITISMELE